ncbi:MAG: nucleotidyltransferase family protein [Desulfobacterales bacterium]
MKIIPSEDKLLLWAAGAVGGAAPAWVPAELGPSGSARLVERAVTEGMAGILFRVLGGSGRLGILCGREGQRLKSVYFLTLQANLRTLAVLKQIFLSLNAGGIRAVVIQGASLLVDLYKDPGLRPLSDTDLWVLPEELERTSAALHKLGFASTALYPRLFRKGELLIDLRTQLMGVERIPARRFLLTIDQQSIFENCRRFAYEGCEMGVLSPQDQALYLTMHAVKHNLERLVWLADLRCLTAGWTPSDWDALGKRAGEIGQNRVPALLGYLLSLLPGDQPAAPRRDDIELSALEKHLLRMRRTGPLPKWSSLVLLRAGGVLPQAEFALESLFPRPAVLRQVFAGRESLKDWQLYALRVRQLLGLLRSF